MKHDIPDDNAPREHVITRNYWCCPTIDYAVGRIVHHTPAQPVQRQEDE